MLLIRSLIVVLFTSRVQTRARFPAHIRGKSISSGIFQVNVLGTDFFIISTPQPRACLHPMQHSQKVLPVLIMCSTCTRALTFENLCAATDADKSEAAALTGAFECVCVCVCVCVHVKMASFSQVLYVLNFTVHIPGH